MTDEHLNLTAVMPLLAAAAIMNSKRQRSPEEIDAENVAHKEQEQAARLEQERLDREEMERAPRAYRRRMMRKAKP